MSKYQVFSMLCTRINNGVVGLAGYSKLSCLCLLWLLRGSAADAQAYRFMMLDSSQAAVSFRGLSAVSDGVVWVAGSRGTVGRSVDGGLSWQWVSPEGYSHRDFRDIEAFDGEQAVIMAVDSPGLILRTSSGGRHWEVVYENHQSGIFLDAMTFQKEQGFCVGDPLDGRFVLLTSSNWGKSWAMLPDSQRPMAMPGEACFAASGSNLVIPPMSHAPRVLFVSGGAVSRLHAVGGSLQFPEVFTLSMQQGGATTGANAIAFFRRAPIIVGGDFSNPSRMDSTISTADTRWYHAGAAPRSPIGYASGVATIHDSSVAICGLRGVALLQRQGLSSTAMPTIFTTMGFHTIQRAQQGSRVFMAGPRGRIAVLMPAP